MARGRKPKQRAEAPGWVWMIFGLGLGLGVAVVVYVSGSRIAAAPATAKTARHPPPAKKPASPRTQAAAHSPADGTSKQVPAEPSAAAATATSGQASRTEFDFYKILPQYEVKVPGAEPARPAPSAPPASSAPPAPVETPGEYILQAGSFRSHDEADRLKASLALLGIESTIQKVDLDDGEYHRVRIGPIDNLDSVNRIRNKLVKAGIDPLIMHVDD